MVSSLLFFFSRFSDLPMGKLLHKVLKIDVVYLRDCHGLPWVFQGSLHPYPQKPTPAAKGRGFYGEGCGFF